MRPTAPPDAWPEGSPRTQALAARRRDAALARVTRLTKVLAVGVVAAVAGLTAFVARAIPGGHTAPASAKSAPAATPTTVPQLSPTSGGRAQGPSTTSGSLSPPTTAPQHSSAPPQTVTSPSVP